MTPDEGPSTLIDPRRRALNAKQHSDKYPVYRPTRKEYIRLARRTKVLTQKEAEGLLKLGCKRRVYRSVAEGPAETIPGATCPAVKVPGTFNSYAQVGHAAPEILRSFNRKVYRWTCHQRRAPELVYLYSFPSSHDTD